MEFDSARGVSRWGSRDSRTPETLMEGIARKWANAGYEMPHLVYWNVDARQNTILDSGDNVSFVSGCSPIIFEQVCKGITGYELMLDKLMCDRYKAIQID